MRKYLTSLGLVAIILILAPDFCSGKSGRTKPPGKAVGSYSLKLVTNRMDCSGSKSEGSCMEQTAGPREHRFTLRENPDGVSGAMGDYDLPSAGGTFHFKVYREKSGETSIFISQTKQGEKNKVLVGQISYGKTDRPLRGITFPGQLLGPHQYDGLTVYVME